MSTHLQATAAKEWWCLARIIDPAIADRTKWTQLYFLKERVKTSLTEAKLKKVILKVLLSFVAHDPKAEDSSAALFSENAGYKVRDSQKELSGAKEAHGLADTPGITRTLESLSSDMTLDRDTHIGGLYQAIL